MTLFSGDRTASDALCAGVATLPAEGFLPLHRHAPAEIYHLLEGSGVMTVDGVSTVVNAGDAVFIPGDAEHGIRNIGTEALRFFYVFPVDRFDQVVYRFSNARS